MIIRLKLALILLLLPNKLMANNLYFDKGLKLFESEKFEEAKFKFEQNIVFNPKSEMSYLYLSKIFKNLKDKNLQEKKFKYSYSFKSKKWRSPLLFGKIKTGVIRLSKKQRIER